MTRYGTSLNHVVDFVAKVIITTARTQAEAREIAARLNAKAA